MICELLLSIPQEKQVKGFVRMESKVPPSEAICINP